MPVKPGTSMPGSTHARPYVGGRPAIGLAASLGLHALFFAMATGNLAAGRLVRPSNEPSLVQFKLLPAADDPVPPAPSPVAPIPPPELAPPPMPPITVPDELLAALSAATRQPASMPAPPAPTAEEWAFAGRYTLKNSKAYRYTWGRQVRSMMGTAVEGPDQGMVRFRVEIAPDGSLASLETLWSTSPVAERLAREAIVSMPNGPATPTGRPLIFDKTISFTPFASDGPPLYKNDCLPDRPAFSNPFAWDGKSAPAPAAPKPVEKPDPEALEDCLRQLPKDSIEAELARDRRLMDRWGWSASQSGR